MFIETKRLRLRRFNEEDYSLIYELSDKPECGNIGSLGPNSVSVCNRILNNWLADYDHYKGYGVFCVEELKTNDRIGLVYLMKVDQETFNLGYKVLESKLEDHYDEEILDICMKHCKYAIGGKKLLAPQSCKDNNPLFLKKGFERVKDNETYVYETKVL